MARPVGSTIFYVVCEAVGNAATPGLLCQPRVIMRMIVEKQMECRLAGETEVLGENLPPTSAYCLYFPKTLYSADGLIQS
jgi:hypothetical protein